jgi:hypothetical protein
MAAYRICKEVGRSHFKFTYKCLNGPFDGSSKKVGSPDS